MAEAFPEFADAFRAIRRGVVQADIIRCVYLYHYGGWYTTPKSQGADSTLKSILKTMGCIGAGVHGEPSGFLEELKIF